MTHRSNYIKFFCLKKLKNLYRPVFGATKEEAPRRRRLLHAADQVQVTMQVEDVFTRRQVPHFYAPRPTRQIATLLFENLKTAHLVGVTFQCHQTLARNQVPHFDEIVSAAANQFGLFVHSQTKNDAQMAGQLFDFGAGVQVEYLYFVLFEGTRETSDYVLDVDSLDCLHKIVEQFELAEEQLR